MGEELKTIKKELKEAEEKSFAMELILNARNDAKRWFIVALTVLSMWLITIVGFLLYLNQYDYVSTTEATGIYNAVDQSGNIVTQDVSEEQWKMFMEWLNNNGEN